VPFFYKNIEAFMSEQTQTYKPKKYFIQFDGARGLLAFSIFILHIHFYYIKVPSTLANFTLHSFFVASAFLITSILYKEKKKTHVFSEFFKRFYMKRILRIFPVYFGYIFVFLIIGIATKLIFGKDPLRIINEIKHFGILLITFTYNFKDLFQILSGQDIITDSAVYPHLWSISMEEQFYILIPFLIFFLSEKTLKRVSVAVILLFPFIRIFGFQYLSKLTSNQYLLGFTMIRNSLFQFDAFFYGILIALLPKLKITIIRKLFYLTIVLLVIQDLINSYYISINYSMTVWEAISRYDIYVKSFSVYYIDVLLNISCFCFLYLVFHTENEFPLLHNKQLTEYGKVSYGSYVYQYIFILPSSMLLKPFLDNFFPVFISELISVVICLFLLMRFSLFSYYNFELKFINMKTKFS